MSFSDLLNKKLYDIHIFIDISSLKAFSGLGFDLTEYENLYFKPWKLFKLYVL